MRCDRRGVARRVEELETWKLCNEIVERVQAATEKAPARRHLEFCDQINDAAGDALSDVAEGFARFYPADFAKFLGYAISSIEEARTRAGTGYTRKVFDEQTASALMNLCYRAETAAKHLRAYLWSVKKDDLPLRPNVPANPRRKRRRNRKRGPEPGEGTR